LYPLLAVATPYEVGRMMTVYALHWPHSKRSYSEVTRHYHFSSSFPYIIELSDKPYYKFWPRCSSILKE
jgi:hypothetical protein